MAEKIRSGIENIGDKWIKENGDVWYQVDGDMHFSGEDYPYLTLEDLLISQEKWLGANRERSEIFDELIRSKTKYLINEDKGIPEYIAKLLQEQGMGDLIDGYTNITKF
ncbi:hypothetical protein [Robertmurraya kyonggiensis]|uniref:Uncharacterized protein n=1 Tax=Robertmurraya kyonggiensis TaxID=1037680 RepID=A0A4U1D3N2_9BACI|nr:hypothetical protein [Robertmurraya kyonggiensis]TKC17009.1 hypothetical protein FA727_13200 [Robertmurraya kyonggiensis]